MEYPHVAPMPPTTSNSPYFNLKDFISGLGTTATESTFAAALAAMPNAGGKLVMPAGLNITLGAPVDLTKSIWLEGAGKAAMYRTRMPTNVKVNGHFHAFKISKAATRLSAFHIEGLAPVNGGDGKGVLVDIQEVVPFATQFGPLPGSYSLDFVSVYNLKDGIWQENGQEGQIIYCDVQQFSRYGIVLKNTLLHDGGDMSIKGCNFYPDQNIAAVAGIYQTSGGGAKIESCKWNQRLGGRMDFCYLGEVSGNTSILQLSGTNSMENFSIAGVKIASVGFRLVQLHGIEFAPYWGAAQSCIDINGVHGLQSGGHVFVKQDSANLVPYRLTSCQRVVLTPSTYVDYDVVTKILTNCTSVRDFDTEIVPSGTGGGTPSDPSAPAIVSISPVSGVAGTTIDIYGTNLQGTTAVKFNGVNAASFAQQSDTHVTATTPTGVTTGKVSVITPNGTAISPGDFVVSTAQSTYDQEINQIGELPGYYNRLDSTGTSLPPVRGTAPMLLTGATSNASSSFFANASKSVLFDNASDYATIEMDYENERQVVMEFLIDILGPIATNTVLFRSGTGPSGGVGLFELVMNYNGTGRTNYRYSHAGGIITGGGFPDIPLGAHCIGLAFDTVGFNLFLLDGSTVTSLPGTQGSFTSNFAAATLYVGGTPSGGGGNFKMQNLAIWWGPRQAAAGQGLPTLAELQQHYTRVVRNFSTYADTPSRTYAGTWANATDNSIYAEGHQGKTSTGAGAYYAQSGNGNKIIFWSPKGPSAGSVDVYLDGSVVSTVSLVAASLTPSAPVYEINTTSGSHSLAWLNKTAGKTIWSDKVEFLTV